MGLFGKGGKSDARSSAAESQRSSSGWADILKHLKEREELRVLDFGATSPSNINYLTGMGHSVYMANIVEDASRPEWLLAGEAGAKPVLDVERFAASNLDFSGRDFDVVLLWDTADYLPPEIVAPLFERLRLLLRPEGRLLAFFHGSKDGPTSAFARYQLTETKDLRLTPSGNFPVQKVYSVRQIEGFLQDYADVRFFLGKDNTREVIAVR